MNGLLKKPPQSPINAAADELIAYLLTLKDTVPNKLFESGGSGIWIPSQNVNGDNTPAFRVWYRIPKFRIDSPQFFAGIRRVEFTICVYLWLPTKDDTGTATDPMRVLMDYADTVLQALQLKDDVGSVGWNWSAGFWGPVPKQDIQLDMTSRLARFNAHIPLGQPWYTVEIPFLADVYNKT
jgi:hypothetical protein